MRKIWIVALTSLIILIELSYLYSKTPSSFSGSVAGLKTAGSSAVVSLSIGEYRFSLFGYSSPGALVTIEGMGIYDQTYANSEGYFEFKNRFSPLSPREACLTAQDQFGRISSPACLPPFPTRYNVTIGPVILPPTISLDKLDYFIGDKVVVSGQTIPDKEIDFSLFIDEKKSIVSYLAFLVKPVEALTFPKLETKADKKGNFSLSFPSSKSDFFRLFARVNYQKETSPKSITLNFKILPIWMIIIKLFLLIFSIIKSRLLEIIILSQLLGLVYFFLHHCFHPYQVVKTRAIVLRKHYDLILVQD